MNDQTPPIEPQPAQFRYGVKGGLKPPGSGRKKGTPNRRQAVPIEETLERIAEELGKEADGPLDVTATRFLYLVLHRQDELLGLPVGTITVQMSFDAACKLIQYEIPKKRSIEVTGLGLTGGTAFVISTGNTPPQETNEQWANRAEQETRVAETEIRLKQLQREKENELAAQKADLH